MPTYHPIDLLLVVYAFIAMPAYSIFFGKKLARAPRSEAPLTMAYWSVIVRGISISLIILVTWHWLDRPYAVLGLNPHIGLWGRMGFILDVAILINIVYISSIKHFDNKNVPILRERLRSNSFIPRNRAEFVLFPFVAIFGSIAEELFYRGYLIWAFTPVIGLWIAVLVSSIAFGLAHAYQGRSRIFQTTLIGLVFAIGFALSRSLWWLMLGHIMINLTAYFYVRKLNRLSLRYDYNTRARASVEMTEFEAKKQVNHP